MLAVSTAGVRSQLQNEGLIVSILNARIVATVLCFSSRTRGSDGPSDIEKTIYVGAPSVTL
jgi:hypothetical protein